MALLRGPARGPGHHRDGLAQLPAEARPGDPGGPASGHPGQLRACTASPSPAPPGGSWGRSTRTWCGPGTTRPGASVTWSGCCSSSARPAGLTAAGLDRFMTGLQQVGIGAAEDMLLTGAGRPAGDPGLALEGPDPLLGHPGHLPQPGPRGPGGGHRAQAVHRRRPGRPHRGPGRRPSWAAAKACCSTPAPALERELAELHPLGKPVAIHAIGGRAIEQALMALETWPAKAWGSPGCAWNTFSS